MIAKNKSDCKLIFFQKALVFRTFFTKSNHTAVTLTTKNIDDQINYSFFGGEMFNYSIIEFCNFFLGRNEMRGETSVNTDESNKTLKKFFADLCTKNSKRHEPEGLELTQVALDNLF